MFTIAARERGTGTYYYCIVTSQKDGTSSKATATSRVVNAAVTPKPITITANDAEKTYDGDALTNGGFTIDPNVLEDGTSIADDFTFTVTMTAGSTITNAGSQPNVIATVDGKAVTTGTAIEIGNYLVTTAEGTYEDGKLTVTKCGTFTVLVETAESDTHLAGSASAVLTVTKAEVTAPTIVPKPYNGIVQTADITDTDIYTVTENNGGIAVGSYDVVLTLKDPNNYKWTDSDDAEKTLKFEIVPEDTNIMTVSMEDWAYGDAPNLPESTARFGADTVKYTY